MWFSGNNFNGWVKVSEICQSILNYSDTLNSEFSSSSPSLFAMELNFGKYTLHFEMWLLSPDMPDINAQTNEPQLPEVPCRCSSFIQGFIFLRLSLPSFFPCWTKTRMSQLGSTQACPRATPFLIYIIHIFSLTSWVEVQSSSEKPTLHSIWVLPDERWVTILWICFKMGQSLQDPHSGVSNF